MPMPVSIREVAARAGVSLGTVSKVLNNSSGAQIATGTRERVRVAARDLGYHPSAVARALVRKQTDTLGVIFPRFTSESPIRGGFFSYVFNEILEAAHLREQDITILSGRTWKDAQTSLPQYRDGRCDGYVVFFQFDGSDLIESFLENKVPFVLVNDCNNDPRLSCVDVDNHESAFAATRYLLSLGHRRIAHLPGNIPHGPVQGRIQGYKEALKNAGIPFDPRLCPAGDYMFESVAERVTALMGLPEAERPTGIFCGADGMAVSTLRVLARLGVRVPEDVSVVGHDDLPEASQEHPPLTTMRQPFPRIGLAVIDELLSVIGNIESRGNKRYLSAELVVRESTAKPVR